MSDQEIKANESQGIPMTISSASFSVRVAALTNINIDSPGGIINGVTLRTEPTPDIVLLPHQANTSHNGLYVFNGAGDPMTRF